MRGRAVKFRSVEGRLRALVEGTLLGREVKRARVV